MSTTVRKKEIDKEIAALEEQRRKMCKLPDASDMTESQLERARYDAISSLTVRNKDREEVDSKIRGLRAELNGLNANARRSETPTPHADSVSNLSELEYQKRRQAKLDSLV